MKANSEIRNAIATARLKNWEVANEIGISDGRFSVWLRTPLKADRKDKVMKAINNLSSKDIN